MQTQNKKPDQKVKIDIEKVQLFHIDNPIYINKTAKGILDQIEDFARIYRLNKHNKKEVEVVRVRPNHFKSLMKSVNASLKKNEKRSIDTDRLVWNGINIIPISKAA